MGRPPRTRKWGSFHMRIVKNLALGAAALASVAAATTPASALTIELRNTGGVEVGTNAYFGFTQAAKFWELMITNNVNVKLNVGFGALNPGVLGSTGSTTNGIGVGVVLPALQATGNSAIDAIAAANLPETRASAFVGGQAIDALISAPKVDANGVVTGVALPLSRVLDADASANNSGFSANTSLMKALGLTPTYTGANAAIGADGTVTFSTGFAWDFDPTNGIDADKFDFIGVAIHEIGHALGFRSGVDTYDNNVNFNGNIGNFAVMSIWDIFRYSQQSAALGVNDWAIGGTSANGDAPFFSIDGGASVYNGNAFLSTGRTNGDGRQASHWKDNIPGQRQLGVLDPTVARGQQSIIEALDLAAYDAMGWNISFDAMRSNTKMFSTAVIPGLSAANVPEPAAWAMMIAGFGLVGGAMRRRQASVKVTYA
jgi:PEP-CTERM motif